MVGEVNMKNVYLTGYEKETIDQFIAKLKHNKITSIVDIRELPLSRKPGFSKRYLSKRLSDEGIKYTHLKSLGSPSPIRKKLKDEGNYINFFNQYRAYIKHKHIGLQKIVEMAKYETICVMCFEKECELCHRTIVADEILKMDSSINIRPV
jgi:uncharacterized protein (DUF488 family)